MKMSRKPLIMALEPRFMFDGAALVDAADTMMTDTPDPAAQALPDAAPPAAEAERREVAFVDASVDGFEGLVDGLAPGVEVFLLTGDDDAVAQMADALQGRTGLDAIHIVSHGSEGEVRFASGALSAATLDRYRDEVSAIGAALADGGDLLLWGCDIARGNDSFLRGLAEAAGADVAASDDRTGHAARGGDWELEIRVGEIAGDAPFTDAALAGFSQVLAPTTLTFTSDVGAAWDDGIAEDGEGGSTDIPGITIQVLNIGDADGTNHGSIDWMGSEWLTSNGFDALTDGQVSGNDGWRGMEIRSADGSEFQLNGFEAFEWGYWDGRSFDVIGYRDGAQVATGSWTGNTTGDAVTVSLGADFDYVDVVRTIGNAGNEYTEGYEDKEWIAINNIIIDDPVVPNAAPAIAGTAATPGINDTATSTPFSPLSFTDGDGDGGTVAITYTGANGTLSGTGLSGSAGNYTLSGANPTELTNRLQALVFTPTENQVAPGSTVDTTFTLTPNDGTTDGSANNSTVVTATSVNDTPTDIALSDATVAHSEGSSNVVVGALSTTDADTGESFTYSMILGAGDTDNASFNIDGANLRANDPTALAHGTYSVRIRTTDGDAFYTEAFTITVTDDVAPAVSGTAPAGSPNANDESVDFTVTFGESVTNVTTGDFALTATGSASGTIASVSGSGSTYTVTVNGIAGDGTLRLDLQGSTDIADGAGTAPAAYTSGTAHTVDRVAPTVTVGNIALSGASGSGGAFKLGDTVTATWNNTAGGDNNSDTIATVTVDFSAFGGGAAVSASNSSGSWSATHTITAGAIDATNRNVSVTATDDAGNATTVSDDDNATVDNAAPTVTDGNISVTSTGGGSGGVYIVGDTITVAWNNTGTGENNADMISSVTVDFSAFGGGAAVAASNSSGTWTASYTLTSGSIDGSNLNVSVTATDNAGNATTTADSSNLGADNQAPTVSDARIAIAGASGTGGAFRVGDTVTATWNNTAGGDNNGDIASVTIDFSAFGGGAAVTASNSSGTWSATYTLTEGGGGAIDATNRNVSVTATDDAGNATTTADSTNATVDNTSPGAPTGTLAVDENSADTTVIGTVSGGGGDGVTYSLTDNAGGRFAITTAGEVSVADGGLLDHESNASHGIAVRATDNAGNTTDATLTVTINDVNEVPTVNLDADDSSGAGGNDYAATFSAGGDPVAVADSDAALADVDDGDQIESLTATLGSRPDGDAVERLSLNAAATTAAGDAGLTVGYTAATGVLSITGAASAATYQTILRGIVYENDDAAVDITTGGRSVSVVANDGDGNSATATATITVVTAPVVSVGGASYTEGGGTISVAASATITEPDGDNLNRLVIQLTNPQNGTDESITLSGGSGARGGITVTYDSAHQITLTGTDAAAAYQALLRELQYQNSSDDPGATARTITVQGRDAGGNSGAAATLTVTVTPVNDAPSLTATGSDPTFTEGDAAVGLFSGSAIDAVEAADEIGALVLTVGNVADGASELLAVDGEEIALTDATSGTTAASGFAYAVGVSGGTATVTLTRNDTAANWRTLIDNLGYRNASDAPSTANRVVTITSVRDAGGTANGGDDTNDGLAVASTVTVAAVNDAPVLGGVVGATWTENTSTGAAIYSGDSVLLFSGATLADPDTATAFDGATATVALSAYRGGDLISLPSASGTVTYDSGSGAVAVSGTTVGTVAGGSMDALTITFNANASGAAIEAVLNAVVFTIYGNDDPIADSRTVTATFNDNANGGAGALTGTLTGSLVVSATNDTPTLTASAADPTFTEGGAAVALFSGAAANTVEAGQTISGLTLTVSSVADATETLSVDGTTVALIDGASGTTAGNGLDYVVGIASGTATVTLSGGTMSAAQTQTLVDGIAYFNGGDDPTTAGGRTVTVTALRDSGGTANSASDTASPALASTITLAAVNDAPVLANLDGDAVSFAIGGAAVALDAGADATLGDLDNAAFGGGAVTVAITANRQAGEDVLRIGAIGPITAAAGTVSHGGTAIGTYAGGSGSDDLVVSLNAEATVARVQDLIRALQYTNSDAASVNTEARTVRITVNDGADDAAVQNVTVAVARAPIIDLDGDDSSGAADGGYSGAFVEDGGAVAAADSDNAITDDGTFRALTVTLASRPDGAAEALSSSYGVGARTVNGEAVTIAAYDAGTGALAITVDDGSADAATMRTLIGSIRYDNSSDAPTTTAREITFAATDNDDNTGPVATATLSVTATNDAPTAGTTLADPAPQGSGDFAYTVPADAFADADGDTLSYSAALADGSALPAWLAFDAATRSFSGNPPAGEAGRGYEVRVTAADGNGGSASQTFTLALGATNDVPTAGATLPAQAPSGAGAFSFAVPADAFADGDGDALTLSAMLADGSALPSWLAFDAATRRFSGNPPASADGLTFTIRVTAADGQGGSGWQDVALAVAEANDTPVAVGTLPDGGRTMQGGPYSRALPAGAFADADGDTLSYSASGLPRGLSIDAGSGLISGRPDQPGSFTITVIADDGYGGTASLGYALVIDPLPVIAEPPPVARPAAPPPQPPPLPAAGGIAGPGEPAAPTSLEGGFQGHGIFIPEPSAPAAAPPVAPPPAPASRTQADAGADGQVAVTTRQAPAGAGAAGAALGRSSVNVGADGRVSVMRAPGDAAAGLVLRDVQAQAGEVRIEVETVGGGAGAASYSATLADGSPLPAWMSVDPATGTVTGRPPEGVAAVNLRITANSADGRTQVLEVDLEFGEEADGEAPAPAPQQGTDASPAFLPLARLIEREAERLDGYGERLYAALRDAA